MNDNIIDITNIIKKNAEASKDIPEYYTRFLKCYNNQKINGSCKCDLCEIKDIMSDQLLNTLNDMAVDYMKDGKHTLYYGDILEVSIRAAIKLQKFCQKEHPNPPAS